MSGGQDRVIASSGQACCDVVRHFRGRVDHLTDGRDRGRTASAWLRDADFEDEPGLPLNSYRYALLIRGIDRSGAHYYATQEDTARRVYDALVAKTTWRLWLLFDDVQVPAAHRDMHTAA